MIHADLLQPPASSHGLDLDLIFTVIGDGAPLTEGGDSALAQ